MIEILAPWVGIIIWILFVIVAFKTEGIFRKFLLRVWPSYAAGLGRDKGWRINSYIIFWIVLAYGLYKLLQWYFDR